MIDPADQHGGTADRFESFDLLDAPDGPRVGTWRRPEMLYHYTSGQGLLGMLHHQVFWASHVLHMNDRTELRVAFDIAVSLLDTAGAVSYAAGRHGDLAEVIRRDLAAPPPSWGTERTPAVFVLSFTEQRDDLSQWRGYCSPGDGYCLGFRTDALAALALAAGWRMSVCDYAGAEGGAISLMMVDVFRRYANGEWAGTEDPPTSAVRALARDLLRLAPTLKHEAFSAEREWRLISPVVDGSSRDIHFRPGRSSLVPYVELPFSGVDPGPLVDVTVGPGPNPDLAHQAVIGAIAQTGRPVTSSTSEIPYRAW